MLGLDTLVSQAYGARDIRECHRWFFDGLTLAGLMTVPIMALLRPGLVRIPVLGFHDAVRPLLESYFGVMLLEHAVPARLCGVPALPAGHARRHAGDVRAGHREPDQRRRQLAAHLRPLRVSRAGRGGRGVGHGDLARLHAGGRCCSRCGGIDRKRTRELRGEGLAPALRDGPVACRSRVRPGAAAAAAGARLAGRVAGGRGGRRVCARHRADRARSIRSRARRTRSRSTWPASPSWCRSASARPARCGSATPSARAIARARRPRAGRRSCSAPRFMIASRR